MVSACPACGSANNAQVGREATGFTSLAGGTPFQQRPYTVGECATCGLIFKSHTLSLDQLDEYYAKLECATYAEGSFPTDRHLSRLLTRLPEGSTVLDFGCSTGRVLNAHTERLVCYGVEPNAEAARIARAGGTRIVTEADLRAGHVAGFDAIILADVYEHLLEPSRVVDLLAGLLAPGGRLLIVTGNADAIRMRDFIAEFWYFRTPAHLIMASMRHFRWLAARVGIAVEACHLCSHYDTPVSERAVQYARSLSYFLFQTVTVGPVARVLRAIPVLNRAARWANAPALTCTRDHVVAVLSRPVASGS